MMKNGYDILSLRYPKTVCKREFENDDIDARNPANVRENPYCFMSSGSIGDKKPEYTSVMKCPADSNNVFGIQEDKRVLVFVSIVIN
jgi:hypothetical protein